MDKPKHPVFAVLSASHAINKSQGGISHLEFCTLLAIANRANSKTGLCWASYNLLAADMMISKKSVQRAVDALYEAKLIIYHRKHRNPNGKFTLEWSIDVEFLEKVTATYKAEHAAAEAEADPDEKFEIETEESDRPVSEHLTGPVDQVSGQIDRLSGPIDRVRGPVDHQSAFDPRIESAERSTHNTCGEADSNAKSTAGAKANTPENKQQSSPPKETGEAITRVPPARPAPPKQHKWKQDRTAHGQRSCEDCGLNWHSWSRSDYGYNDIVKQPCVPAPASVRHLFEYGCCEYCRLGYEKWQKKPNYQDSPCNRVQPVLEIAESEVFAVDDIKDTDGLEEEIRTNEPTSSGAARRQSRTEVAPCDNRLGHRVAI